LFWTDVALPRHERRYHYAVYARYDLEVGKEVISAIPKAACLSARTCKVAELLRAEKLGGGLALNVAIMYELWLGDKSRWAGYFKILPQVYAVQSNGGVLAACQCRCHFTHCTGCVGVQRIRCLFLFFDAGGNRKPHSFTHPATPSLTAAHSLPLPNDSRPRRRAVSARCPCSGPMSY
jgi:hypothetical protein